PSEFRQRGESKSTYPVLPCSELPVPKNELPAFIVGPLASQKTHNPLYGTTASKAQQMTPFFQIT
ncbi:hypothetical protein ACQUWM_17955, partial [Marinobacter sp. DUT-3]|uniref:hypothetical protein n=1 Tax=Marinobacter sp. DUT-3 TaxID=3412036 RepID=UPI003D17A2BE